MTKPTPAPDLLPAAEFAEMSNMSERHLRRIAKDGYFPPPEHGQYPRLKAMAGMIRYQRELLSQKTGGLKAWQEKLTQAKWETVQYDLAVKRGDYIAKDDIGPCLRNLSLNQRAQLQYKLEREIPPRLIGKTPVEQLEILKGVVDDVCDIMASGIGKWVKGTE